ncbi:MAG TPA: hypothetical protein VM580_17490 [Labilithrix sp.]|jgi:hypothetical protein|nr:hypothetical protein [Labilithrix sp.]
MSQATERKAQVAAGERPGLDPRRARVAFRERSIADVLDLALRFMIVEGRSYAKVALGSLVPLFVVALVAGDKLGWAASWAVLVPMAVALEIPFTVLASRLVFEERVRTMDVLRTSLFAGTIVFFARVLSSALVVLGMFVLFVPGIWLAAIFCFVGEAMLLERASMGQAFGRSHRLASSAAGQAFVGVVVLAVVSVGSVVLADIAGRAIVGEVLQFRPPRPFWAEGGGVLSTLGLFAQIPYVATVRFFLYLDVRTRAEGWDIQARFAAIAARANEETRDAHAA